MGKVQTSAIKSAIAAGNKYTCLPKGWRILSGALTAPIGYVWASNGESLFSGKYQHMLLREDILK